MKRLICLLLLAGMLVSILVGCSGKTEPPAKSDDSATETEPMTDTPPEPTEQELYHPKKEDLDGYMSGLSGTLAALRGTADAKLAKFLKDLKENAAN